MKYIYTKKFIALATVVSLFAVCNYKTGTEMQLKANEVSKREEKKETYYVIDASFIDHSGSYEECVEYADYYNDNHDYVVVTAKDLARDIYE